MSERLLDDVRTLLDTATRAYAGTAAHKVLDAAIHRLDEPLRVAIAGKVKAGKSTLLNALVGERLAPTDESECTRIVTWYRDGISYLVTVHPRSGEPRQAPFRHEAGAIEVDLGGTDPDEIDHLVVDWPAVSLREMTLLDTPGIASVSTDVSARTYSFLTPGDEHPTEADAVLYLMRHLHSSDLRFLESFHDDTAAQATAVNAIAVLSRADEVGVGRLDAMTSAHRIAARYRADSQVQRLCQTVVPVAGLLAETAATLREDEYRQLALLAEADGGEVARMLLSADRFANLDTPLDLSPAERRALMDRLGMFGLRLSIALIREGRATNAGELAAELRRHSGVTELVDLLVEQFGQRTEVLKARAALLTVEHLLRTDPPPAAGSELEAGLERVLAGAHEFTELQLLNILRTGRIVFDRPRLDEATRILGAVGHEPRARLGLTAAATTDEVRRAGADHLQRWQHHAENPLTPRDQAEAARVVVRTLEGLVTGLR